MSGKKLPDSPLLPYIIITLAATFYVYEFCLRVMPSAMTTELMHSFDIEASGLGFISALFFYGYAPMQLPAGLLIDRLGPRVLLSGSVLVCSLGALIFGLTDHVVIAAIGRLMIGVAAAFAFIGTLVLASRWFAAEHFALITGLVQFMGCIGAIAGAAPIALVVKEYGWRPTQISSAVGGLVLAGLFWLFIRDNPPDTINTVKHKDAFKSDDSELARLKKVLHNKQTWAVGMMGFCCWAPITVFAVLWGVPFLKTLFHTSTAVATRAIACIWIGIAFASPFVGWWSNRINSRRIPLIVSSVIALISSICILYTPTPSWTYICMMMFFMGTSAGSQAVTFGLVQDNMPPTVAGTAVGFNNMAVIFAGVIFQPLVGILLDWQWSGHEMVGIPVYTIENYQSALLILPLTSAAGLLTCLFLIKETRCTSQYELEMPN